MNIIKGYYNDVKHIKPEKPIKGGSSYWNPNDIIRALTAGGDPCTLISDIVDWFRRYIYETVSTKIDLLMKRLIIYKDYNLVENVDVVTSKARMIKRCIQVLVYYHNVGINILTRLQKSVLDNLEECKADISYIGIIISRFRVDVRNLIADNLSIMNEQLYRKYVSSTNRWFGMLTSMLHVEVNTYDICTCREFIIPDTNISVFEFLFMDLNLTHLPILNHEELMIEEFKTLERLIIDKCNKLYGIYEIHLIFNKKRSNFPEDCTNYILEYCPRSYELEPAVKSREHEHMEMLKTVNQQSFEKRAGCVFPDTEVRKAIVPYGKDYAENQ